MKKLPLVLVASVVVRKLTATVVVKKASKPGKCVVVTHAGIWYGRGTTGGRWLGEVALAGRWTEAQVLAEFAKNPKRWNQASVPKVSSDIDITLAGGVVARFYNAVGVEYTPEAALAFFQANPALFERGESYDLAERLRLVPLAA
jgi:hypothetical protein